MHAIRGTKPMISYYDTPYNYSLPTKNIKMKTFQVKSEEQINPISKHRLVNISAKNFMKTCHSCKLFD